MLPDIQKWFDFADSDLGVAKHLRDTYHPVPIEIICYHCQQAAEKAIKGLYLFFDVPGGLPRKHDLSFLLDQIKHKAPISDELYDYADELNSFAVVVRYPSEIPVNEVSMKMAIHHAEYILVWAKSIVS